MMFRQGEQLGAMDGKLDDVDDHIEINGALLMEVAKASVRDKIIQLVCAIFTLAVIALMVIAFAWYTMLLNKY